MGTEGQGGRVDMGLPCGGSGALPPPETHPCPHPTGGQVACSRFRTGGSLSASPWGCPISFVVLDELLRLSLSGSAQ